MFADDIESRVDSILERDDFNREFNAKLDAVTEDTDIAEYMDVVVEDLEVEFIDNNETFPDFKKIPDTIETFLREHFRMKVMQRYTNEVRSIIEEVYA